MSTYEIVQQKSWPRFLCCLAWTLSTPGAEINDRTPASQLHSHTSPLSKARLGGEDAKGCVLFCFASQIKFAASHSWLLVSVQDYKLISCLNVSQKASCSSKTQPWVGKSAQWCFFPLPLIALFKVDPSATHSPCPPFSIAQGQLLMFLSIYSN